MNDRVRKLKDSGIRKFHNKVKDIPGAISLTIGQPDFKMPQAVKNGLINALEENKTQYTLNEGIEELREEISSYLKSKAIKFEKDEIILTVGGSEGLYSVMQGLLNPDDKVLIPNPGYPAYESIAQIIGAKVIPYNLNEDFSINISDLKKTIQANDIKAIIISYPSNPTGGVLDEKTKNELYNLLKNEDIYIITDDIYAELIYDDEYYTMAQCEDIIEKVIYVSGFSKMFSMTGLRLGYVCAKRKILEPILRAHQYNVSCAASVVQWAALEGLKKSMDDVNYMREEFKHRRDYCYDRLLKMGFSCELPKGAFYLFPSIEKFNMKSEEFCTKLLNEAKVACVPGNAFGSNGDKNIRISYCYSMDELERAMNSIEEWVKSQI